MMPSVSDASLKGRLAGGFSWRGDASSDHQTADLTGWWREPSLLRALAFGLAELSRDGDPTVVLGIPSRGVLLGSLVADRLGVGLVDAALSGSDLCSEIEN
jgi:adenine phosphoribosyltransferase